MHLTINSGIPPTWNLVWEYYDGLSFLKYRIWRKSASEGWQLIDSVSASSTTYSDLNPPAGALYYVIEIISPGVCNPSLKTQNILSGYSSSFSNIADNGVTGISEINDSGHLMIYPNPFTTTTTVQFSSTLTNAELDIYNLCGQKIRTINSISTDKVSIDRDNLPKGIYFIRLTEDTKNLGTEKLIITD